MVRKILLAEDDKDDQNFFRIFLQDKQDLLILPIAFNGEELIEYLGRNHTNSDAMPDLIILDHNMPKMNGLKTLEVLKKSDGFSHIPVMIYSTYADEELIGKSLAAGAHMVETKPQDKMGYHKLIDTFGETAGIE